MVIDHHEPDFILSRCHVIEGKTNTWSINLTTDGKEVTRNEAGRTLGCRIHWEHDELVFETTIATKDGQAINVVKYSLSADCRSLTGTERFTSTALKYANTWVLDKQ